MTCTNEPHRDYSTSAAWGFSPDKVEHMNLTSSGAVTGRYCAWVARPTRTAPDITRWRPDDDGLGGVPVPA